MKVGRKILRGPVEAGTEVDRFWSTDGYVEVPKEMLRQAGFDHGSSVQLEPVSDGIARVCHAKPGFQELAVHQARMCLRLWKGTVRRAGLNTNAGKVTFVFSEGGIEVRT